MKTVLLGGKFNKIHPGHVWLLKKARSLGDRLVVVLAHDKNNSRPYAIQAEKRKEQLTATNLVDEVVIGDPKDFFAVIGKYKPSVIVLGYDQELPEGVKRKIKPMKIEVVRFEKYKDYSTRKLVE